MSDFILELRGWAFLLLFHHYLKDAVPAVDMATVCLEPQLRLPDTDAAVRGPRPRPPGPHVIPWRGLVSLDGAEHKLRHMIEKNAQHDRAHTKEEHLVSNSLYYFHRDHICNTSQ